MGDELPNDRRLPAVDYARPARQPSARHHPAVAVATFLAGMAGPALLVPVARATPTAAIVLLFVTPGILLCIPSTQLAGAGWMVTVALLTLVVVTICGG